VRLENGKLPGGYYEAQGKRCRVHIGRAIDLGRWEADETQIKALASKKFSHPSESLQARIVEYARLVETLVPRILSDWQLLF
jgi:hypothetical protein